MSEQQPVVLVSSRHAEWAGMAAAMAVRIRGQVPDAQVEHIGSTSVPDLPAKDVVDLLVGVPVERILQVADELAAAGFDLEGGRPGHRWLSWPSRSARTHVLHVVETDGTAWQRRIAFRNLLRRSPEARNRYVAAKRAAAEGTTGWDAYTQAKTGVVAELLSSLPGTAP